MKEREKLAKDVEAVMLHGFQTGRAIPEIAKAAEFLVESGICQMVSDDSADDVREALGI